MRGRRVLTLGIALGAASPAGAQTWNDSVTTALIARGIARRAAMQADSGLRDFQARAHGFVFFLGQMGEGLAEPPRLIKADQLALEVYWKAPGASKQRIIGWRDRLDLPTDINYHRDHLGIVLNGFGNRIQLGEGTEVRGVPHPLAPEGPALYDYALADSLTIEIPQRAVRVYEVLVRPREFDAPRVAGTLYLDAADAELVRFRFKFTRRAYIDQSLEDIAVVLDNGLWEGRYWLPRRQEIEIRRHTTWLDLPVRGIIRGRWEIDDYALNRGLDDALFGGPEIVAAPAPDRARYPWPEPIDAAIAEAVDAPRASLEEVHAVVRDLAVGKALSGLPVARPGAASLSDLLHVNRVEGLTPGFGFVLRPGGGPVELRAVGSYGLSDRRFKGRAAAALRGGRFSVTLDGGREVRDVGDEPLITLLFNSLLAQELGIDYGDYVLRDQARLTLRQAPSPRTALALGIALERTRSVARVATPVRGTYRENFPLGAGRFAVGRLTLSRSGWLLASARDLSTDVAVEGGAGEGIRYARVDASLRLGVPLGRTDLQARSWGGWASARLPVHRAFLWGGRGAIRCDPVARCGGRYGGTAAVEWRVRVPVPAARVGPIITTGRDAVIAPFVAVGWLDGSVTGAPWSSTGGVLPVAGVAVEWFHQLLRAEVGVQLRTGRVGVQVDLNRDLWSIL